MAIYIIDTTRLLLEECIGWENHITLQIDFALGVVFLLLFFLRMLASGNMLSTLFTRDSIVDMFTLPPLFLSVWLGRTWLGLRFFRFFTFLNLPDVLTYARLLSNSTSIRLAQLMSVIIGAIFWAAGFILLLENSGDPWHNHENAREKVGGRQGKPCMCLIG
jgi:potassium large conductance calcium-activated channel subfamily M alpha protein 1